MQVRFFNPGLAYKQHKTEFDSEIQRVLERGDLILREDVEEFERNLAGFVGTKYAIALNSGTDALYLTLKGLGIGPGDTVLVPARTFVATAQVVVQLGATPVYYDMDAFDNGLDVRGHAALMVVHLEGEMVPNMEDIISVANFYNVPVIEDACQALGASQNGKMAGSFGIAGAFSFYPAKILGGFGDGGAVVTDNPLVMSYVREARNHFKETNTAWGVNSRLDNLQAAVLNIKMRYLEGTLNKRQIIANRYTEYLENIPGLELPPHTDGRVWQDYIVRTVERDDLKAHLASKGVETLANNYPFPDGSKLPLAQAYEDETLRLPCNETITMEEVDIVINAIRGFFNQ